MQRRAFLQGLTAAGGIASLDLPLPSARRWGPPEPGAIVVDGLDTSIVNEGFLELLETGKVDCVHKSMGDAASYGTMYAFLARHRDVILPAFSVREIREAKAQGKRSIIFGVQHGNLLEALIPKDATGSYDVLVGGLRSYHELGVRVHGICYNVANIFGGGCLDPRVPLTRAGRRLVEEIHRLNIVLDVGGHTGEQTSLDALAISTGVPVVCTHTNVAALNPNARATSNRVFEAIARTGGVVGITAISDFQVRNADNYRTHGPVSPQATLDVQLDQYEYLKKLIGVDHVGLGPDFVWGWGEVFDADPERSITFPSETLSKGHATTTKDFENISKLPNLVSGLRRRGWTQPELDQVLGANWLRVYEQVWGG